MWDLPGPGLEPVSPALAGGFLTTTPPGKSYKALFLCTSNDGNKSKEQEWNLVLEDILRMWEIHAGTGFLAEA